MIFNRQKNKKIKFLDKVKNTELSKNEYIQDKYHESEETSFLLHVLILNKSKS